MWDPFPCLYNKKRMQVLELFDVSWNFRVRMRGMLMNSSSLRKGYLSQTPSGQATVDDKLWKQSTRHSPCLYRRFCSFAWICPLACCGVHPQHSKYLILGFGRVICNRTCSFSFSRCADVFHADIPRAIHVRAPKWPSAVVRAARWDRTQV